MSTPSITVRFIRTNEKVSSNDDRVCIHRVGANQYSLAYTYGHSKKIKNKQRVTLTDDQVFRWMRFTIGLIEKDAEPFELIQIDLPYMPSVVFNVSEIDDAYHRILDALNFHLNVWPPTEEEAEEYAGMPSLEPFDLPPPTYGNHLFMD